MVELTIEDFCEIGDQLEPLFQTHYDEIANNKEVKKIAPDWDTYRVLTDHERCIAVVAWDGDEIVGYTVAFLYPHPHYKDCIVAANDLFYVRPEYRRQGVASMMISFMEEQAAAYGATVHTMHMKPYHDFSTLMERLGYYEEEVLWEKVIQ